MAFRHVWNLDAYIGDECADYESDFVTKTLMVVDFWWLPWYFIMVTAMIFYCDVFFLMVTLLTWYDLAVNYILNLAIQETSPIEGCVWFWEMPSYQTELLVMLGTLFTLMAISRDYSIGTQSLRILLLFSYSIVFYRAYAHINTPDQLYAGALVGLANGLIGYAVFWFLVLPSLPVMRAGMQRFGVVNMFFQDRYDMFVFRAPEGDAK